MLIKELFGSVLFGSSKYRMITTFSLLGHLAVLGVGIGLLWAFPIGPKVEDMVYKMMPLFVIIGLNLISESIGTIAIAWTVLKACPEKVKPNQIPWKLFVNFGGLFMYSFIEEFILFLKITINRTIFRLLGTFLVPICMSKISEKRFKVNFFHQMDMILPIMVLEDLGIFQARRRTVDYLSGTWGKHPEPRISAGRVLGPILLPLTFLGIIPGIIIAVKLDMMDLLKAIITLLYVVIVGTQFLQATTQRLYSFAAFRYTEYGKNDFWVSEDIAPRAYVGSKKVASKEEADKPEDGKRHSDRPHLQQGPLVSDLSSIAVGNL